MKEKQIEMKSCLAARKKGWWVRKISWIARKGAPDRLFAKDGNAIFIEFKSPLGKISEHQKIEIDMMKSAGLQVFVARSVAQALSILDEFDIKT